MWFAGSVLVFTGAAIAGLSGGETVLFGLIVSFMLIMVGGLFWMELGRHEPAERELKRVQ